MTVAIPAEATVFSFFSADSLFVIHFLLTVSIFCPLLQKKKNRWDSVESQSNCLCNNSHITLLIQYEQTLYLNYSIIHYQLWIISGIVVSIEHTNILNHLQILPIKDANPWLYLSPLVLISSVVLSLKP